MRFWHNNHDDKLISNDINDDFVNDINFAYIHRTNVIDDHVGDYHYGDNDYPDNNSNNDGDNHNDS